MTQILDKIKRLISPQEEDIIGRNKKYSFSQSGEDIIMKYILDDLGINNPSYLDIGAFHPFRLNNTAIFYDMGCSGINVEPDPYLFQSIVTYRKQDTNLNIGISDKTGEENFYLLNAATLNTFSKEEAERYERENGYKIKEVIKVKTETVPNIVLKYHHGNFPEILSLDVEGLEESILQTIDYQGCFPIVMCIETITFSETGRGVKNQEIINFVKSQGYLVYADTNINTIFVRQDVWER